MVGQAAPESSGEKMLMLAVNEDADESNKDFFPMTIAHKVEQTLGQGMNYSQQKLPTCNLMHLCSGQPGPHKGGKKQGCKGVPIERSCLETD